MTENIFIGMKRLTGRILENSGELLHTLENGGTLSDKSASFLQSPTYGDGGMAAAVGIVSAVKKSFEL